MAKYSVEVWVVTSYRLEVDADDEAAAEKAAESTLQEHHVRDAGGMYEDNWQDVMSAEKVTA